MRALVLASLVLGGPSSRPVAAAEFSRLWGEHGELWSPAGRLPDFSFAGYRQGEEGIPTPPVRWNVRDFGANGDDALDDTEAFKKAIAETEAGVIFVPEGRYVISDLLYFRRSGVILRGAGPDRSVLYFPKTLTDIKPNWGETTEGRRTSNYSWSGGFLWVEGDYRDQPLALIPQPVARGELRFRVDEPDRLEPGGWITIRQRDEPDNSLAGYLYADQSRPMEKLRGRTRTEFTARVVSMDGREVTLNRALPTDLHPRWRPEVLHFDPTVTGVGIENLGFEFPVAPYEGHFTELGCNPLTFRRVAHCWARNLHFQNAESGIFAAGRFCTFDGIVFDSDRVPDRGRRARGHHGIYLSDNDNLFTNFRFNVRYIHDLTVSHCAGNVCSRGSGEDLCFDHHKRAPYANLFTRIDLGRGTRMYECGGGAALGKNAAAWTTFWNITAASPQTWPPDRFGPDRMNLVGVSGDSGTEARPEGKWREILDPKALHPANLHEAQLERRLK